VAAATKQNSFASAVKWAYAGNLGERGFSAVFTLVLAAFLGPRVFGTISIALTYIAFLQMFIDQGFVAALIQKKNLEEEHLDSVFWVSQVLSLTLVVLSIVCSKWWAARNHAPEVALMISILSICIPIEGLAIVQTAVLKKDLDFRNLTIRTNVAVLVAGGVAMVMAIAGFGVWALVAQQVVRDVVALIFLWKLSPWRPRFRFSFEHMKSLLGFSASNFMAQLGIFANLQADSVILGLFFGPFAVGLYRLAERIVNTIITVATQSIQNVALPEFSRLQDDRVALRKSALACVRLTSAITLPPLVGLAMVARPLMATLGPQWVPASLVLTILSILGVLLVFSYFTSPLLQALSRPHHLALLEWGRTIAALGSLVVVCYLERNSTVQYQIAGIAVARLVVGGLLVTPIYVYILVRLGGFSFGDFVSSLRSSFLASAAIAAAVGLFEASGLLAAQRPIYLLAAEVAVGGTLGLAVLFGLEIQLRRTVADLFSRGLAMAMATKDVG